MTNLYHDPIPLSSPANTNTLNIPLGQLDAAINNVLGGLYPFSNLMFSNAQTYQISSNFVSPEQFAYILEAETGTRDEIDAISVTNNSFLLLKAAAGHEIVLTQTLLGLNNSEVLITEYDAVLLYCQNSQWHVVNQNLVKNFSNKLYCMGFEYETFSSSNTISIQPGVCASDTGITVIESPSAIGIDLTTTGAQGLDTGTIAANTSYYIWLLKGESGVTAVASDSATNPIPPSGYEDHKRRIGSFMTDSSANVLSGFTVGDEGLTRRFYYTEVTKAAPYQLLNEANIGQTGSRTSVDFTNIVPAGVSRMAICLIEIVTPSGTADVFWSGTGSRDKFILSCAGTGQISSTVYDLEISRFTRTAQIYSSAAVDEDLSLYCIGWVDYGLEVLGYLI